MRRAHNRASMAIINCQINRDREMNRGITSHGDLTNQGPASSKLEWPLWGIVPRDREHANVRAREQRRV